MSSILGPEKLGQIEELARWARQHPGDVAEFGVYQGGTLELLAGLFPDRTVYGFDTFEGLPKQDWTIQEPHNVGDFRDTDFIALHKRLLKYPNIRLVKGYFPDSATGLDIKRFCFAHIDFDFYRGTKSAIEWLWPKLNKGGIAVFDDYGWEHCPGVKQAILESEIMYTQTAAKYQAYAIKP